MKLKPFVVPSIYFMLIIGLVTAFYFTTKEIVTNEGELEITYVSNSIFDKTIPVVDVKTVITNPYTNQNVKIARYFYNSDDEQSRQEDSIVFYNNTYMPNTGIDYTLEEVFEVNSILDGTVIEVKDDETLGKIIEIRHTNDLISVYQGLSEASVLSGDIVLQGQVIGKSGTNELNKSLGNHLHFELYKSGAVVDPLKYIGKNLGDI